MHGLQTIEKYALDGVDLSVQAIVDVHTIVMTGVMAAMAGGHTAGVLRKDGEPVHMGSENNPKGFTRSYKDVTKGEDQSGFDFVPQDPSREYIPCSVSYTKENIQVKL